MDNVKKLIQNEARLYWEVGMLKLMFKRKIISEKEYEGIKKIIEKDKL